MSTLRPYFQIDQMNLLNVIRGLILLAIFLVLVGAVWLMNDQSHQAEAIHRSLLETASPYPIIITDLKRTYFLHGRLRAEIRADTFKIHPRKFYLLNVRGVNEVYMSNLEIKVYESPEQTTGSGKQAAGFLSLSKIIPQNEMSGLKGHGLVTRAFAQSLRLESYYSGQPILAVTAERAVTDFKTQETTLSDAVITHLPTRKRIETRRARWNDISKVFVIPGAFTAKTPKGRGKGRGIIIDTRFNISPLR